MSTIEYNRNPKEAGLPVAVWLAPMIFLLMRLAAEYFWPMIPAVTTNSIFRLALEIPFYWLVEIVLRIGGASARTLGDFGLSAIVATVEAAVVASATLVFWSMMRLVKQFKHEQKKTISAK